MIAIVLLYWVAASGMLRRGVSEPLAFAPLILGCTVLLVVVLVIGHVIAATTGPTDVPDERDRLIRWRAEGNAAWIAPTGILVAIAGLMFAVASVWIVHLLFTVMFVAEIAKLFWQLVYYRRGL